MSDVDRRTLLLGSAGVVVLGACSGEKKSEPDGPIIVRQEAGNVVTTDDAKALVARLNQAFEERDLATLVKLTDPDSFDDKFEKRWKRRFDNFERIGVVSGEWFVGQPTTRTRNASGGLVEYSGDLVFAHRVDGCDALNVVESFSGDFRKKSVDAPLEVLRVGEVVQYFDPSIWDLAKVDAIETAHTVIVFREQEAGRAKQYAKQIESGAARAFDVMPRPEGVSKVFVGLTWPKVKETLWGGSQLSEAAGNAYVHKFLDPGELAKGQKSAAATKGAPVATGRIGLHAATFDGRSSVSDVACHEAVHVLANQWGESADAPDWSVEGLAGWGDFATGSRGLLATHGGRIRSQFAGFRRRMSTKNPDFYGSAITDNYNCAAAVYEYLEAEEGRDTMFKIAKAHYTGGPPEEQDEAAGVSRAELLERTQKWLRA